MASSAATAQVSRGAGLTADLPWDPPNVANRPLNRRAGAQGVRVSSANTSPASPTKATSTVPRAGSQVKRV